MRVVPTSSVLALSAYGNDMDVEHNACRLGRVGWPARCGEPPLNTTTPAERLRIGPLFYLL